MEEFDLKRTGKGIKPSGVTGQLLIWVNDRFCSFLSFILRAKLQESTHLVWHNAGVNWTVMSYELVSPYFSRFTFYHSNSSRTLVCGGSHHAEILGKCSTFFLRSFKIPSAYSIFLLFFVSFVVLYQFS